MISIMKMSGFIYFGSGKALNTIQTQSGKMISIRCGGSVSLGAFKLGEKVPSDYEDGVYTGYYRDEVNGTINWVIIKDCVINEIFDQDISGLNMIEENNLREITYNHLMATYDIIECSS